MWRRLGEFEPRRWHFIITTLTLAFIAGLNCYDPLRVGVFGVMAVLSMWMAAVTD
jgi:hypothetical protein